MQLMLSYKLRISCWFPLTLEILDGPIWLGQVVLRNELTVRSTILVDPFLGIPCTSMTQISHNCIVVDIEFEFRY